MTPVKNRRIGLVDDDDMVRYATGALLSVHKFHVEEFDSGESLLSSDSLGRLDCLLIDYRMNGMSGLQLLQELKNRKSQIPTVVMSGFTTEADATELTAAGAAAILDKPVRTEELLAELMRVTGQGRAA